MIEMTEGTTAVVIETEEVEGIAATATAIRVPSTKRKRSSKLAEDQERVIEVTTGVTLEVLLEVVN